jgi:CxxC motif-containing protein (DUF1111 family)
MMFGLQQARVVCSIFVALNVSLPCIGDLLTGGETTVFDVSVNAFGFPATNLALEQHPRFFAGNAFFNTNWVDASSDVNGRDGLGPLFNVRSCSACHFKDGRGQPPEGNAVPEGWLMRISIPGTTEHKSPRPDPVYGNQVSVRALPGAMPEARVRIQYTIVDGFYPDGESYQLLQPNYSLTDWAYGDPHSELLSSPRVASAVFGLGLLEAVSEEDILSKSDPDDQDGDGISGRPNWVWSPSLKKTELGRFGWKANKATLTDQTAGAFLGDIGITNSIFPQENDSDAQGLSVKFPSGGSPELSDRDLEDVVFYMQMLAVPAARIENRTRFIQGKELFAELRCAACHIPHLKTSTDYPVPVLAEQSIRPYTDLLLHDMGEGLADGRPDFEASGTEWRTPPLWGIGLLTKVNKHTRLLHDGRARNVEEAILWHGGEAEVSKREFRMLTAQQRELVIGFVESL